MLHAADGYEPEFVSAAVGMAACLAASFLVPPSAGRRRRRLAGSRRRGPGGAFDDGPDAFEGGMVERSGRAGWVPSAGGSIGPDPFPPFYFGGTRTSLASFGGTGAGSAPCSRCAR